MSGGCAFGCGPYPEDSVHVGAGIGLVPACPTHGWVVPMLDARDDAIKAAEARCVRLQQALDLIKRGCEMARDDLRPELWKIHQTASEALAGQPTAAEGPDTPADSQEDKT